MEYNTTCKEGIYYSEQDCLLPAKFFLSVVFDLESGDNIFLRRVGELVPDHTVSNCRIYYF